MKTGVMSPALCAAARDRMWECNASKKLVRNEPATHVGPFAEDDTSDDPANKWGGTRWQLRSVGGEQTLMDMLPRVCEGMAAQLLGEGAYMPPTGGPFLGRLDTGKFLATPGANTRGIYCTLPERPGARRIPLREQPGIHFDSGAETDDATDGRFKVTGLIDDTAPGCGGFTVYPRSVSAHRSAPADPLCAALTPSRPCARSTRGCTHLRSSCERRASRTQPRFGEG